MNCTNKAAAHPRVQPSKRISAVLNGKSRSHKKDSQSVSSSKYVSDPKFACSGLSTARLRPSFDPVLRHTNCFLLLQNGMTRSPTFADMPVWLKPLLYIQHQHGHREDWLCSLFRDLPANLMKEIRSAFLAVIVLVLDHMRSVGSRAAHLHDTSKNSLSADEELWHNDNLGLSDENLATYHGAEFGVIR